MRVVDLLAGCAHVKKEEHKDKTPLQNKSIQPHTECGARGGVWCVVIVVCAKTI